MKQLLSKLPASFPAPLAVVQHRLNDSGNFLSRWLDQHCAIRVCEAEMNSPLLPGLAYIAPANYHLLVEDRHSLALCLDKRARNSRPSIDVFFESAAMVFGANVLALTLTGANEDGAAGAVAIKHHGGSIWAQDPADADFPTMPRATIAAVLVDKILPLSAMAAALIERCPMRNG